MNPTVSVIIPAYNADATLARCLDSVLTQSLRDIEVVCINDGSTDGSVEVLKQFVSHEARLHVYSFEKNYGTVIATKFGVLNAKGKYVMFVDSDDVLLPGACENLVRLIEKYDVDVLQFGMKITAQPGVDISGFEKLIRQDPMTSEGDRILYDCFALHRFTHNIANKIFRREVCRAAAETMPDLWIRQFADLYLAFFFLYRAKTFRSISDIYYEYMFGNGISTHAPDAKQFADICTSSAILPAIEWFLKRENALDKNQFLLDSIRIILKSDVVNKLLTLPEITEETIELTVKSWGSEVMYDFLAATGLLDIKCETRLNLVSALVNQIRKQNISSASGKTATISVGQPAKQEISP
jgi:glycosyltransferase involved in cell wall biosynthesis